jgi:hypothetical protein
MTQRRERRPMPALRRPRNMRLRQRHEGRLVYMLGAQRQGDEHIRRPPLEAATS